MSDADDEFAVCPNCMGDGSVPCYCAGDFCLCDNAGDAECPTCGGDRYVTHERFDKYLQNRREAREMLRKAMEEWA